MNSVNEVVLTDIGHLAKDWEIKTLEQISSLMTNGFVGTATSHYVDEQNGILYIQGYNVEQNSFNLNGIKYVSKEFNAKHLKSQLKEGDLLTIQTGDVGLTTFVSKELEGSNCHALIITRLKSHLCDYKFISHYLNSHTGRARLKLLEIGSTMKHLNVGDLLDFKVPTPELPEQQKIAQALTDADNYISALEKLIVKYSNLQQANYQRLFSPKKHWKKLTFDDVCTGFTSGMTPSRKYESYFKGNIPWITSGELNYNVIKDTLEKITPEAASNTNLKIIPKGTFLMAITGLEAAGTRGSCAITGIPATTNQSCMALYPKSGEILSEYLFHYYVFHGDRLALEYTQGTKQQSYNAKIVKILPIDVPPIPEQQKIVDILNTFDIQINSLKTKLEKTRALKKGMMQKLLTGEIRLA